ncbi:MAG: hypothetical protein COC22_01605 [Flavobacteriaceae bacterium]|nr:MAG: hypothetical protein COC22_01605 [Flavobacteriaceae bacterium]
MAIKFESWSNKQLCYIFVGWLIVFAMLRWDMGAWLSSQLDRMLAQNHIEMQYQALNFHGDGVALSSVKLHIPQLPKPLLLDTAQVNLDWAALLHGQLAFNVTAKNSFFQCNTLLSSHDEKLKLDKLYVVLDVKPAQRWLGKSALLQASGQATLEGSFDVDMQTRLPASVHLQMQWRQAAINVVGQDYVLGDYSLRLDDQSWVLHGGEQLELNGKGRLVGNAQPVLQWPLHGKVQLLSKEGAAIANILPLHKAHVNITGTLGLPYLGIR